MADFRNTVQMSKILSYLKSVKSHPTADKIFGNVKKGIPSITLATVYRNLEKLSKQGLVERLEVNGEFRFDAIMEFHQHAICNNCGSILDLFHEKISKYALEKFKSGEFFTDSVLIIFYGLCKKCAKNTKL